jgi:cyclopropane-fatty-acyl-phospholipid synthase
MNIDHGGWQQYWENRTNGGHRRQSEEFLKKEADEKLFHIKGGRSLLDFGCGSADLLAYVAPLFDTVVGADFSLSMLKEAENRLKLFGLCDQNVQLIHADDASVWKKVFQPFDRIAVGAVIQYLQPQQVEDFIAHAIRHLTDDGRIILFDVIDPAFHFLFDLGLYWPGKMTTAALLKRLLTIGRDRAVRKWKHQPPSDLGYMYSPTTIRTMLQKYPVDVEIAWSMYYEYRFHVIINKSDKEATNTEGARE